MLLRYASPRTRGVTASDRCCDTARTDARNDTALERELEALVPTGTVAVPARREYKYLVPLQLLPALRAGIRGLCDRDRFSGPDGTYLIRSLYLDTPAMHLYHANEREAPVRFKARIRSYPGADKALVFVEIKNRDGDVVRKARAPLRPDQWQDVVRRGYKNTGLSGKDLGEFLSKVGRYDLRPVVLVQYRREAWASRFDDYARVSIDTEIVCQAAHRLDLSAHKEWRPVDHPLQTITTESPCVVELKFAERVPAWMVQVVRHLDLLRASFSKYCYSMFALGEDHLRDYRRASSVWG